jgi:hypothetical protein
MAYKYQLGTAILSGALSPGATNTFDLGAHGAVWNDAFISGTAAIATAEVGALTATANLDIGAFDLRAATLTADSLTAGQVLYTGTDGVLSAEAGFEYNAGSNTLTAVNVSAGALSVSGLAQLDGGLDVDGAFAVGDGGTAVTGFATISGSGNSTVGGSLLLGPALEYGLTRAGVLTAGVISGTAANLANGNLENVGQLFCDVIEPVASADGLALVFSGDTTKNKLELTNSLADALNITEAGNSFLKFNTATDKIIFGQDSTFTGTTIDHLGTVAAATSITTTALVGGTIAGSSISGSALASLSSLRVDGASVDAPLALGADAMYFFDATDSLMKKQSWSAIATAMAGSGLTATAGVLSSDASPTPTDHGNSNATLVQGFNFSSVVFATTGKTWTLPASPDLGDTVTVKAPSNASALALTIAGAGGLTIDGEASIIIDSDYGAVALVAASGSTTGVDWYIK